MIATFKLLLAVAMLASAVRSSSDVSQFLKCKLLTFQARFDLNDNGVVDSDDFEKLIKMMQDVAEKHYPGSLDELNAEIADAFHVDVIYLELPLDKDKVITVFVGLKNDRDYWVAKDKLVEVVVRALDLDNDGFLQSNEFELLLEGLRVDSAAWDKSFAELDINHDGKLSPKEVMIDQKEFYTGENKKSGSQFFYGPLVCKY